VNFTRNQRKAHDLNRHISVTAGAGSGKTAVLVHRYLKILLEKDLPPNQVVAITFTEKAAAELKQRVVNEVNIRLKEEPHNTQLERIKIGMLSAQISTIHAFCSRILREYPVEAGVDASFSVLQDIQQRLILRDIIDSTLREIADRPDEDATREKLVDLLRIFGKSRLETHLSELVDQRWAVERLKRNLYYRTDSEVLDVWQGYVQSGLTKSLTQFPTEDWLRCLNKVLEVAAGSSAAIVLELVGGIFPQLAILSVIPIFRELGSLILTEDGQISKRDPLDSNAEIDITKENVGFLVRAANYFQSSPSITNASIVLELVGSIVPELAILNVISIFRELAPLIVTKDGKISKRDFLGSRVETDTIKEEIDFLVRAGNHLLSFPSITDDDELLIRVTRPLLTVYSEVHDAYENQKSQARQLDFDDLQIKVRDLLQQESIREQLAQRYPYIMVDEYQDTDQLQYEILRPLISDFKSGNLSIVGDQNQSIYRFRGADVRVFDQTRKEITEYQSALTEDFTWEGAILEANDLEKRGDLHLPENFRLLRNLVGFVNLVFRSLMKGRNEFEIEYKPLIQGRTTDSFGDVELLISSKEGMDDDSQPLIDANNLIAKRIRHLVGTGETIWQDESDGKKPRQMRYGDIAILIRSRTRLPEIETALLKEKIPYKITGGIGFYQRQEIYDIGNYLEFLINPTNDVALAGVLRAPFFGVSDVELYEITQPPSRKPFWEKVQDCVDRTDQSSTALIGYAVQTLRNHLEICHRIPPSELIRKIVNDTGMVGVLPVGQSGEQRWANYEKLLGIAREFERLGFTDLHDFLERLNLLIEEEEREGQATTQLTADAVEIMTIHAAKGLEFPVVILPNLDRRAARYDQEPFVDDLLGIGFRPANPDKNYEQSEPGATQLMRERARDKRIAEEQRLFYVATTRARDRLILSGSLNDKGKAGDWLGWLFDALAISGLPSEGEFLNRKTTIRALSGEKTTRITFDLPIRIIKSPDELNVAEEEKLTPPPSTEFPAYHIDPLIPSSVNKIFSVAKLTTYAHCPTRFYLQHQIQVPPSEPQSKEAAETDRKDANRFLDSRVREIALNTDEVYRERHIHAEIGSHIVDGTADRLFRDSRGLWRVINYERDRIDWEEIGAPADYYRSQIELYALLVHRLHPEQQVIPVTICSTDLATPYSMEITREQLADIESTWLERIEAMQVVLNTDAIGVGRFEKNREHCPLCPYFVGGECMVAD
jgi:ATP-dependent exoDNAse (exonuclease V) beta subunit